MGGDAGKADIFPGNLVKLSRNAMGMAGDEGGDEGRADACSFPGSCAGDEKQSVSSASIPIVTHFHQRHMVAPAPRTSVFSHWLAESIQLAGPAVEGDFHFADCGTCYIARLRRNMITP